VTLDQVAPGRRARVLAVSGEGGVAQRVLEMGLVEGTEVEVVRLAPLGDPLEIRVYGYLLSLRRAEAAAVSVEPA
jgi:Fe2+ transport system protein FeoA